jgi:hypothetical protein
MITSVTDVSLTGIWSREAAIKCHQQCGPLRPLTPLTPLAHFMYLNITNSLNMDKAFNTVRTSSEPLN